MKPSAHTVTITEYRCLYRAQQSDIGIGSGDKALEVKAFDALEAFFYANSDLSPFFSPTRRHGEKALRTQNYVGVIQTKDGTTVEILPKIADLDSGEEGEREAKNILLKMLKTLKKSPFRSLEHAHLKTAKMPLLEIFISMFLEELAVLVRKGIKNDYIGREENLGFLKGKLNMGQHIRQNYIHKERFFVEYDEYLPDRIENRLIKTTLEYLYKKSRSSANQQRIREFQFVFDGISSVHDIPSAFSKVRINRQMRDYEQVLLWCRTFLLGNSFSPYKGDDVAFALLFDMNLLFESYVGHWLKKQKLNVKLQDKTHHLAYLDGRGKFQLKPDFVIDDGRVIADTKWKLLSQEKTHQGVAQSDMYQLFAYGKKYDGKRKAAVACEQLVLIYPKQEKEQTLTEHDYNFDYPASEESSLKMKILFFDLFKAARNGEAIESFWLKMEKQT